MDVQRLKNIGLSCLLLFFSCFLFEDEPDEQNTNLTLSLHSAGVTTVNLNVSPEDSLAQFTFELTRDDSTIQTLTVQSDTLINDTGLNPNTNYTYKGHWINGTKRIGESDALIVTTMDTTSHNFIWEIDTLDTGGYLTDVWIVDENNIWVVGYIVTDSIVYNAAHWDGEYWEFIVIHLGAELNAIYYFSENDIWVLGGYPIHWNGNEWTLYHLSDMGVIPGGGLRGKMWGSSSNNMYFVGASGRIVHYDGNEFVKMESETDVNLSDIICILSPNGLSDRCWATGYSTRDDDGAISYSTILLLYENNEWIKIYEDLNVSPVVHLQHISHLLTSLWTDTRDSIYIVNRKGFYSIGYSKNEIDYSITPGRFDNLVYHQENNYNIKIRGSGRNDLFLGGEDLLHFNGMSFKNYDFLFEDVDDLLSISMQDDFVVVVGGKAISIGGNWYLVKPLIVKGYR